MRKNLRRWVQINSGGSWLWGTDRHSSPGQGFARQSDETHLVVATEGCLRIATSGQSAYRPAAGGESEASLPRLCRQSPRYAHAAASLLIVVCWAGNALAVTTGV